MTSRDTVRHGVGAGGHDGIARVSTRSLAELAKAGYLLAKAPVMQIDFEVHHVSDSPGYLLALVNKGLDDPAVQDQPDAMPESVFVETLSAAANGIGVMIGTRPATADSKIYSDNGESSPVDEDGVEGEPNVFRGTARPNPSFTFESQETFGAIISIDYPEARSLTFSRSLAIKNLIAFVSALASDSGAALLSAQWPAQVPPKVRVKPGDHDISVRDEGPPPYASSLALRFSFAVGPTYAAERMRLGNQLSRYAQKNGFGLWLSDSRMGHRTGNWFHVCSVDPGVAAEDGFAEADEEQVRLCLPVTFVGPARVGSTSALMSMLAAFPFVGVVGCANTTLDDLAFINLQLSLEGLSMRDIESHNEALRARESRRGDPMDILQDVFAKLGYSDRLPVSGRDRSDVAAKAFDYKTVVGTLFPCVPVSGRRRMALWFSWQVERNARGLLDVVNALYRALARVRMATVKDMRLANREESPNLEYLICRQFDGSVLRGKGKLSIPKDLVDRTFRGDMLEQPASKLAALLEAAWKSELLETEGLLELTVAWRESWLGHWASSLY